MKTIKKAAPRLDDDIPELELTSGRFTRLGRGRHAGKSRESGIAQGEISKIENRDDLGPMSVAVLRRYIEALGGELELVAVFPKHRFRVTRGSPLREPAAATRARAR